LLYRWIAQAAQAAQTDVLLQALSFAVTGSDGNKVIAIDRPNCIFKADKQCFLFQQ
jgi:hypothetical protein